MNKYIDLYYRVGLSEFNEEIDAEEGDAGLYLPILEVDEESEEQIRKDVRMIFNDDETIEPRAIEMKQVFIGIWQDWRKKGGDGRYSHCDRKY